MKKTVFLIIVLLLLSTAMGVGSSEPVVDEGVIFIRADGSVGGTDKIQRDRNVYTFTDNINVTDTYLKAIVVERENIIIDGAGYILQGWGAVNSKGIDVSGRSDITIRNVKIREFYYGVYLNSASDNEIIGNNITENAYGIGLWYSSNNRILKNNIKANIAFGIIGVLSSSSNRIYRNEITANTIRGICLSEGSNYNSIYENNITRNGKDGITFGVCLGNSIYGNNIANHENGIQFFESSDNSIYHNNFVNNTHHVYDGSWDDPDTPPSINIWDDDYPSGGNYWREYTDADQYSGLYQNETGSDGTWDHPYIIYENNQDNYPLTNPWIPPPSEPSQLEPLSTWLVTTIIIVVLVGAALLIYSAKVIRATRNVEK